MHTFTDLIKAFGGPYRFAEVMGIEKAAALQMSSRNRIHSDHWATIVARAPHAKVEGITLELIASLKGGRDAKSSGNFRRRKVENQIGA